MGQSKNHMHALPATNGADEPTVGMIKRALHELPHHPSGLELRDYARTLREVHDLVRRLALLNGIDPDAAVQRRRDAVQAQRECMVVAGANASGQVSS